MSTSARARDYLDLVRFPLFAGAAADSAAGYVVSLRDGADASWVRLAACAGASCFLYAAGLAWNDFADRARDARDRPGRPIPSGRVSPTGAAAAAALCAALGLALALGAGPVAFAVASGITLLVLAYDFGGKRIALVGALLLALARMANFTLGRAAARGDVAYDEIAMLAPLALGLYVFWLTLASTREERATGRALYALCAVGMAVAATVPAIENPILLRPVLAVSSWLVLLVLYRSGRTLARFRRDEMERSTAWFVLGIVVLDAAFVFSRATAWEGLALLAWAPALRLLTLSRMRHAAAPDAAAADGR